MVAGSDGRDGAALDPRAVVLAVVLAASTLPGPGAVAGPDGVAADDPEPRDLVERAATRQSEASIRGVRTDTVRHGDETDRVTVALRVDPPNRSVSVVRDASRNLSGDASTRAALPDRTVLNGSSRWEYYESANRAVYAESSGYWISDTQTFGPSLRTRVDAYEFSYAGVERVAGRRAHVVEMSPPPDVVLELSVEVRTGDDRRSVPIQRVTDERLVLATETWWIDTTETYPVRKRIEWADDSGTVVMSTTRTYEELSVGVDHDESTFRFDPPADAEVVRRDRPEPTRFENRTRANAATALEIPVVEPALPEGYELQLVSVDARDGETSVLLLFYDGRRSITVGVSDTGLPAGVDGIERGVGAVNGTLTATGDGSVTLWWSCADQHYRVSGPMETDTLVETAAAVGCPTTTARARSLKPRLEPPKHLPVRG
jgi:outer membrane lipoprotein-sorting protein